MTRTRAVSTPAPSLADAYPEIAAQWHPELNDRAPNEVRPNSTYVATWHLCVVDPRHVWRSPVGHRTNRRSGCAVCAGKQITVGVSDLATVRPDLAAQWHPTLNDRGPDEVSPGSRYLATWFNCPGDPRHVWRSHVKSRTKGNRPYGCSVCAGKQVMPGISDLGTTHPELAAQWHPTLNDKNPDQVGAGSSYKAYWTGCSVNPGHIWRSAVGGRTNGGTGCSVCAGQIVQQGFNDLATLHPELAQQWHPTLNDKPPTAYTGTSGIRVYWLCAKGHEWPAAIASRSTGPKAGCPECSGSSSSKPENLVRSLLASSSVLDVQSHRPVRLPIRWLGRNRLMADIVGNMQGGVRSR